MMRALIKPFRILMLLLVLLGATACQGQNTSNDDSDETPVEQPIDSPDTPPNNNDDSDSGDGDDSAGDDGDRDDNAGDSDDDVPSTPTTPNGSTLALPPGVPAIDFPLGSGQITTDDGNYELLLEVASTSGERQRGLMFRTSMPEDSGMMFVFEGDRTGGFWMYNTFLPLSIAYIDGDGVIVTIRDMQPCAGRTQTECSQEAAAYLPTAPYRYALEVNQGYFAARGIEAGDSVSYSLAE
ncbi:MAG: DUF192 domain-containing protein [Deinococcota bacterium]